MHRRLALRFATASPLARTAELARVRVVRHQKFIDDLYDAYAWIAPDSERAAERLLDRVDATVERLLQHPMIGAPREPLAAGLRSIRVRPFRHVIFYRVTDDEVVLIRLLHDARALEKQDYGTNALGATCRI